MSNEKQKEKADVVGLSWILEHAPTVLATVGLVVYGMVRFGIDTFYSTLGVKPEEVGLGYAAILSQAALWLLFLVTVSAVLGLAPNVLYWFMSREYWLWRRRHPKREPHIEQVREWETRREPWVLP